MLTELRVRNLAVIEDVTVALSSGLNVLTGETGAGKSMVVDALSLLLGERASADVIRPGSERAIVEAVFEGVPAVVAEACDEAGVDVEDDRLVFRREINASGRNRAWANGSPTTVTTLARLGSLLVDLHGQHETQSLLRPAQQRDILDEYADSTVTRTEFAEVFRRVAAVRAEEAQLRDKLNEVRQRADYLRHVAGEIREANLRVREDEELEVEAKRLGNVESLTNSAERIASLLDGEEDSVTARLAATDRAVGEILAIDSSVSQWRELLDSAIAEIDELTRAARDYASDVETDPERLAHVEQRRDLIFRLTQKYGPSIERVLSAGDDAARELDLLDTADLDITRLEEERKELEAVLRQSAARLSEVCAAAAERLVRDVNELIPALGMPEGKLEIRLEELQGIESFGAESVRFDVKLNPGMPARPLAQVASGGELSRIMLALKAVLSEQDTIPTLVFDEVDQGIGGDVANRVAEALARVGDSRQVLVITHLAQVAARALLHLTISKSPEGGIATANVAALQGGSRVIELSRMLGNPSDDVVRRHAEELLRQGGVSEGAA
ncbi:MAG: DNA repair protein RecN [Gemmatimonadales bacterium]